MSTVCEEDFRIHQSGRGDFTVLPNAGAAAPPTTGPFPPDVTAPGHMTKHKLLDLSKAAVADRGLNYGHPEDNFNRIAERWRVHMLNRFGVKVALDGVSVAIMMADMKAARLENDPSHVDSWVDFAGYVACGAEIACK